MQLGWIDFSQEDKRNALNMLAIIRGSGAVDELGLGVIRDTFANYFFPGTSTIQTRAKYFIIMNNILDDFSFKKLSEKRTIPKLDILEKSFRNEEFECAKALAKNCTKNGKREVGIIGGDDEFIKPNKLEEWIKRTPSVIYWNGLKTYNILGNKEENIISVSNYLKKSIEKANAYKNSPKNIGRVASKNDDDECESDSYVDVLRPIHSPCEYEKTENWIECLSLRLSNKEASFLKNKIIFSVPDSLLAIILKNDLNIDFVDSLERNTELEANLDFEKAFPHEFESFANNILNCSIKLNDDMKYNLKLAIEFNKLASLARIRYNIILSGYKNEKYLAYWKEYSKYAQTIPRNLIEDIYLQFPIRITGTKVFLEKFLLAFQRNDEKIMDELVFKQEIFLKKKARAKLNNPKKYYISEKPVWIGGKELDFRLNITKTIVRDIYESKG